MVPTVRFRNFATIAAESAASVTVRYALNKHDGATRGYVLMAMCDVFLPIAAIQHTDTSSYWWLR